MCRLCNASLNTSGGGSNEFWAVLPSGASSGVHKMLRPEGRGTESTGSLTADTRVRRFGFSSGSSDGGGSAASGEGSVGGGAELEGSVTCGTAAVSDEMARRETRGVEGCDSARSFRG